MYEWLENYTKTSKRIAYLETEIEISESELKRWVSGDLQNVRLEHGSRACSLESNIKRMKDELNFIQAKQSRLIEFIDRFDDLESKILSLKYIHNKNLQEISEMLGYSYAHIKRKHSLIVKTLKYIDYAR